MAKRRSRRRSKRKLILILSISGAALLLGVGGLWYYLRGETQPSELRAEALRQEDKAKAFAAQADSGEDVDENLKDSAESWQKALNYWVRAIVGLEGQGEAQTQMRMEFVDFLLRYANQDKTLDPGKKMNFTWGNRIEVLRAALRAGYHKPARDMLTDIFWERANSRLATWQNFLDEADKHLIEEPDNVSVLRRVAQARQNIAPRVQPRPNTPDEQLINQADDAMVVVCQKAPNDVQAWVDRAEFLRSRGLNDRAIAVYQKGIAANPDSPALLASLAVMHLATNDRDMVDAQATIHRAESAMTDKATSKDYLALASYYSRHKPSVGKQADPDKAIAVLEKAQQVDPRNHKVYLQLYDLLVNKQQLDEAKAWLRKGIEGVETIRGDKEWLLLPADDRIEYRVGMLALQLQLARVLIATPMDDPGRDAALAEAAECVKFIEDELGYSPERVFMLEIRGYLANVNGDTAQATSLLQRAFDHSQQPSNALAQTLHILYMQERQYGLAEKPLNVLAQRLPDSPQVLRQRVVLYLNIRRYAVAKAALDRLEAQRGQLTAAGLADLDNLTRTYQSMADQQVDSTVNLAAVTAENAVSFFSRAMELQAGGDLTTATEILQAIVAKRPTYIQAVEGLKNLYLFQKRPDDARKLLDNVAPLMTDPRQRGLVDLWRQIVDETDPARRDAIYMAYFEKTFSGAELEWQKAQYFRQRGMPESIDHLKKAVELEPANASYVEQLFQAYISQDDFDGAETLVVQAETTNVDGFNGRWLRAQLLAAQSQWDQTIPVVLEILGEQDTKRGAHTLLGQAYAATEQIDLAQQEFVKARGQNPTDLIATLKLAQITEQKGQWSQHQDIVLQAYRFPRLRNDAYIRARYHAIQDRLQPPDVAIARRKKLADENAEQVQAGLKNGLDLDNLQALVGLYLQKQPPALAEARKILEDLYGRFRGKTVATDFLERLVNVMSLQGDKASSEAMNYLERARREEPDKAAVDLVYGRFLLNRKEFAEAENLFTDAIKEGGNLGYYWLSITSQRQRKPDWPLTAIARMKDYVEHEKTEEAEMALILMYISANQPGEAIKLLDVRLAANGDDVAALIAKGNALQKAGQNDQAVAAYTRVLELDSKNVAALLYRAQVYVRQDKLDQAIQDLDVAYAASKQAVIALTLSEVYLWKQDSSGAELVLRKALDDTPGSELIIRQLADLSLRAREWSAAASWVARGKQVAPNSPSWYLMEARMRQQQGDFAGQVAAIQQAFALAALADREPSANNWFDLFQAMCGAQQFDEVIRRAGQLQNDPSVGTVAKAFLGRAQISRDKLNEGLANFKSALADADPGIAPLVCQQLYVSAGAEKTESALNQWLAEGRTVPLLVALGHYHSMEKNWAKAIEAYLEAGQLATEPTVVGSVSAQLGETYYADKQYDKSAQAYREAIDKLPEDVDSLNNLAYILVTWLDKPQEALPLALRATQLRQADTNLLDTLGVVYIKLNRMDDAERTLYLSVDRQATAANLYHLGQVLEAQGKKAQALLRYQRGLSMVGNDVDDEFYKPLNEAIDALQG